MDKKYLKVVMNLGDNKKRTISVKNIQIECTDENLKGLSQFVENFVEGTKEATIKVEETKLV